MKRQPMVVSTSSIVPRGKARSGFRATSGERLIDSTPPASISEPSPSRRARPACTTASSPEAHSRFTVTPGTSTGSPAMSEAIRATLRLSSPAALVQPITTSSTAPGSSPVRATAASITRAARSSGRTVDSAPPYRPMGVRTASMMSASPIAGDAIRRRSADPPPP